MTKPQKLRPTIDEVLDDFFALFTATPNAEHTSRATFVREHLETFLELEGPAVLTSGQVELLLAERELAPDRAFTRTMAPDDLYYGLEHYLRIGGAMRDPQLARTQIDVVAGLDRMLRTRGLVSEQNVSECTFIDVEIATKRRRAELAGVR